MNIKSIWGEIPEVDPIKTPLSILKEQASLLGEKTNGLLDGQISIKKQIVDNVIVSMSIVAPVLGEYTVEIIQIHYGLEFYPVRVFNLIDNSKVDAPDESSFQTALTLVFRSEEVRRIISILIRQVKSLD